MKKRWSQVWERLRQSFTFEESLNINSTTKTSAKLTEVKGEIQMLMGDTDTEVKKS